MRKLRSLLFVFAALGCTERCTAQLDLNNIELKDVVGKVMHVKKGFDPKFSLGKTPINKISKVAEIFGLKQDNDVNRLFKSFRTGRIVYKAAAYTGGVIALYSLVRKTEKSVKSQDYNGALYSGIGAIGSGLIVKFLTKAASYKAVDIFNGIAVKKIKDIFSIGTATNTAGFGLYVKL